jgi:hypothetical protein
MIAEIQMTKIEPRLRIAGALIFLGLLIEALTLEWNSPMAFLVFLGVGGLLIGLGVVFYLFSLVGLIQVCLATNTASREIHFGNRHRI